MIKDTFCNEHVIQGHHLYFALTSFIGIKQYVQISLKVNVM